VIINPIKDTQMISSKDQTKQWRKSQDWYINGKKNECELYQKRQFEDIVQCKLSKTNKRLFMVNNTLVKTANPLKTDQGFEYTENFDGEFKIDNTTFLVNFKFTCDQGGAQLRTLREVYHFIKTQMEFIKRHSSTEIYFINILDGNTSYTHKDQFKNLKTNRIFIGDMQEFAVYWNQLKRIN
jgi:hypothetical protein